MAALRSLFNLLADKRWFWWLWLAIWGGILFGLSSKSTLPPGPEIPHKDKVMHFLYFSGGGFCFALACLGKTGRLRPRWLWALTGMLFGMIAGALDEYHQTFTPGRSGNDPGDWLADFTGSAAGALLAAVLIRKWVKRPGSH